VEETSSAASNSGEVEERVGLGDTAGVVCIWGREWN
jgi:hypothetical protein